MVEIEYHTDLKEVQCDPVLGDLLARASQAGPFDRIAWWRLLARHCGLDPLLAVARDGDAMAALPLARQGDGLAALANWYTFRFRPILMPGARSTELLRTLASDLASRTERMTLAGLPDEDGCATRLAEAFRAEGWFVVREPCDVNHYLEVAGRTYADYLAGRPGKLRTTLKRKSGKVETRVLTRFDAAVWADYEQIYAESWKPEEGSPDFLRAFAEAEGAAGRLRLGIARADGRAVAAQMWTIEAGVAWIHKLAHRESARPLSPGSVLSAALFRHVIDEDRVETVDFGTGDDPYKRDWMEAVRPRYRLSLLRPAAPRNWPDMAKFGLRRLAATVKRG
ncbi:GNAT family N-acetyltransferase [Novosphingobium sp. PC22D]|uniref:GNAT family N-acetyltransferase n=1 Tax=Novosphingobium sp. PC22D TaxID=1962403 RepID=UPI000BFACCDA|nr:GNAT family N-acetyltransferase [Novosphingobium sp. PC22D]PEQ10636.1 GNAT family N-acetyltransferase [Novosphingobium sp. PC22D]